MNTPAHLIFGAAAFARPQRRFTLAAALAGSLAPDLSLYLLAAWALLVQAIPAETVFGTLYFSREWQAVFAIDNSVILWGALLAWALRVARPAFIAFAASGLLHLALDLPFHHEDARRHFWPLSDWVFRSPVSYWDGDRYGNIVGALELALSLVFAVLLWRRYPHAGVRAVVLLLLGLELLPGLLFRLMLH
jgi:hypothetical protein